MPTKIIFKSLLACLLVSGCSIAQKQIIVEGSVNEIEINKTELAAAFKLTGPSDDLFKIYACGESSGHSTEWSTFKRLGLALYSVSYFPEREDGYKNTVVRDIGMFDSTNIKVRKSPQERVYYGQEYYPVAKSNLALVFGKPDNINHSDTLELIVYSGRQLIFAFNKESKQFIRLYITPKK